MPAAVLVAARDEAARIGATVAALARAFPAAPLWVADDGSRDATAGIAEALGARVVRCPRRGKGQAMSAAARAALSELASSPGALVLLCDGDLAESAQRLGPLLLAASPGGRLAVATFALRSGGGFGFAQAYARRQLARRCGVHALAPLSGQRALQAGALERLLPFARGWAMEVAMTIDAVGLGLELVEVELGLSHRARGRGPAGFAHRARQLAALAGTSARR